MAKSLRFFDSVSTCKIVGYITGTDAPPKSWTIKKLPATLTRFLMMIILVLVTLALQGLVISIIDLAHSTKDDERRKNYWKLILAMLVAGFGIIKVGQEWHSSQDQIRERTEALNTCWKIHKCVNHICALAQAAAAGNSNNASSTKTAFANMAAGLAAIKFSQDGLSRVVESGEVSWNKANEVLSKLDAELQNSVKDFQASGRSNSVAHADAPAAKDPKSQASDPESKKSDQLEPRDLNATLAAIEGHLVEVSDKMLSLTDADDLANQLDTAKSKLSETETEKKLMAKEIDEWKRIHRNYLHGPLNAGGGFVTRAKTMAEQNNVTAALLRNFANDIESWNRDLVAGDKRIHEIDFLEVVDQTRPAPPTNLRLGNP
jgi:hypothetical protein